MKEIGMLERPAIPYPNSYTCCIARCMHFHYFHYFILFCVLSQLLFCVCLFSSCARVLNTSICSSVCNMDVKMMLTRNWVKNEESVENDCEVLRKKQGPRRSALNGEESVIKNLEGSEEIPK